MTTFPARLSNSAETRVEWRVVRDDGVEIPMVYGPSRDQENARQTLEERRHYGERGPYRSQRRVIEIGAWDDAELPEVDDA